MSDRIEKVEEITDEELENGTSSAITSTTASTIRHAKSNDSISTDSTATEGFRIVSRSPSCVSIFSSVAINLFLPFVNGMMLGFGEIFAHQLGIRWGWLRVSYFLKPYKGYV